MAALVVSDTAISDIIWAFVNFQTRSVGTVI